MYFTSSNKISLRESAARRMGRKRTKLSRVNNNIASSAVKTNNYLLEDRVLLGKFVTALLQYCINMIYHNC